MKQVRLNLFTLKKQLEMQAGRDYTLAEMSEGMGINYYGLMKSMNGTTGGIQFDTAEKMLGYFRREGLDITVSDLFVEVDEEGKAMPAQVIFGEVAHVR